ncbi:ABC transporter substrate-binding protein, partial [Streptococcus suis]
LLGSLEGIYNYIGFNLGKYDEASGKNVTNPDAKMNNVKLRQAMGYALDNAAIGEKLYNGLYHPTNSLIISFFGDVHDADLAGYSYDPEKAKQLLDEAGYK